MMDKLFSVQYHCITAEFDPHLHWFMYVQVTGYRI